MTRVHLHNCMECGADTGNRSLICDRCEVTHGYAPEHVTRPNPPCLHGADCDGRGLDRGPDHQRKKAAPKPAAEMSEIRARAWATRRAKYGPRGHYGSYSR